MIERPNAVTSKGKPLTVIGPELKVGDKAPDFSLIANDLSRATLADSRGKVRLISVVPSLDTGICDAQTRRFNEEIAKFGDNVVGYTVSADLPHGSNPVVRRSRNRPDSGCVGSSGDEFWRGLWYIH